MAFIKQISNFFSLVKKKKIPWKKYWTIFRIVILYFLEQFCYRTTYNKQKWNNNLLTRELKVKKNFTTRIILFFFYYYKI